VKIHPQKEFFQYKGEKNEQSRKSSKKQETRRHDTGIRRLKTNKRNAHEDGKKGELRRCLKRVGGVRKDGNITLKEAGGKREH